MAAAQQLLVAFVASNSPASPTPSSPASTKRNPNPLEAALKYFLFGGMSAAFLLFGFSLVYGLTGSIDLPVIATQIAEGLNPLLSEPTSR